MKKAVPFIWGNRFRWKARLAGTFKGTTHGNGISPISIKENRLSCSCVPDLSYIWKDKEIKGNRHAIPVFARVKDFSGFKNMGGYHA